MKNADAVAALRVRIEELATRAPEEPGRVERALASLHRLFGWRATYHRTRLTALLELLRKEEPSSLAVADALDAALTETKSNLAACEKAARIHRYVPIAHISWLTRVVDTLARIAYFAELDPELAERRGAHVDAARVLPPLVLAEPKKGAAPDSAEPKSHGDDSPPPAPRAAPDDQRVLELELAAIDHITEAARSETEFIERRRRLLEAARKLLLDASAALPLEREGVLARERDLREQISVARSAGGRWPRRARRPHASSEARASSRRSRATLRGARRDRRVRARARRRAARARLEASPRGAR
ncbi:MAG: hypothetical protein U0271_12325 [Polyangiaceae bacterium]